MAGVFDIELNGRMESGVHEHDHDRDNRQFDMEDDDDVNTYSSVADVSGIVLFVKVSRWW